MDDAVAMRREALCRGSASLKLHSSGNRMLAFLDWGRLYIELAAAKLRALESTGRGLRRRPPVGLNDANHRCEARTIVHGSNPHRTSKRPQIWGSSFHSIFTDLGGRFEGSCRSTCTWMSRHRRHWLVFAIYGHCPNLDVVGSNPISGSMFSTT